jgi:hypothetical protein
VIAPVEAQCNVPKPVVAKACSNGTNNACTNYNPVIPNTYVAIRRMPINMDKLAWTIHGTGMTTCLECVSCYKDAV